MEGFEVKERYRLETDKLRSETFKFQIEAQKMQAEVLKIQSEVLKMKSDMRHQVITVFVGLASAIIGGVIVHLWH